MCAPPSPQYAQALDDGRTDDIVATFCADGVCDIPGMGTHTGHDALREAFTKWKPRQPQRHLVLNTLVTEWDDREATAISDVIFLLWEDSGWAIKLVGRYHDVFHRGDGSLAIAQSHGHVRDRASRPLNGQSDPRSPSRRLTAAPSRRPRSSP